MPRMSKVLKLINVKKRQKIALVFVLYLVVIALAKLLFKLRTSETRTTIFFFIATMIEFYNCEDCSKAPRQ